MFQLQPIFGTPRNKRWPTEPLETAGWDTIDEKINLIFAIFMHPTLKKHFKM